MTRELVLIRHAETAWSLAGRHTGRSDLSLVDAGRERARALAPSLGARTFAQVRVSPLARAVETARLAGVADGDAVLDPDLVEWDYGDYEGRTAIDVRRERPGWVLWRDGAPGGESPAEVAARADRVIERVLACDGDVALVAHGHLLRMIAVRWLELPLEAGARLPLPPARVCVLGFQRSTRVLQTWAAEAVPPRFT